MQFAVISHIVFVIVHYIMKSVFDSYTQNSCIEMVTAELGHM